MAPIRSYIVFASFVAVSPWLCLPQLANVHHDSAEGSTSMEVSSTHMDSSGAAVDGSLSLSDQVRNIIKPECGGCHTSTLPTAKPAAVTVFDLAKDEWAITMTRKQLKSFQRRLKRLSEPVRGKVDAFVEAELRVRDGEN